MADNVCDIRRKLVDDIKQGNLHRTQYVNDAIVKFAYISEDKLKPLNDFLEKTFGDAVLTAEDFEGALDTIYGKKANNLKLAIRIQSILKNNEIYWDWARQYIIENHPKVLRKEGDDLGAKLDELPKSALNNMLLQLTSWAKAGDGRTLGTGVFGKWMVSLTLPKNLAMKEKTGAFYLAVKAVEKYPYQMMGRIKDFLQKPKLLKTKRDYGWDDIVDEVHLLADFLGGNKSRNQENLLRIFIWSNKGDSFNNTLVKYDEELGDLVIAEDYFPAPERFYKDGSPMYMFGRYVPLKEFEGGKFYVNTNLPEVRKGLDKAKERFRKLDDELYRYTKNATEKSVEAIRKSFSKVFKLDGEALDFVLFGSYPKGMKKKDIADYEHQLKTQLGPEKWSIAVKIRDSISGLAVINPYWETTNEPRRHKRNHFPAVYSPIRLPMIFEKQIKTILKDIENGIDPALMQMEAQGLKNKTYFELKAKKKSLLEIADRYTDMLNRQDEITIDYMAEGESIPFIRHQVHMKKLSNTIHPLHMRADSGSYQASLKRSMSAIERNYLIATTIEQMGRAKSDTIRDMILNYFKVPFGFTDVKAKIGPFNLGTQDIVRQLGRLNIKIDPSVAQEWFRIISSGISGQYLSGMGTTLQNMTAIQQNIIDWGTKSLSEGLAAYKEDKEGWRDFIQRSGVIEFRDFFNKTLTSDYIHDTIELDTHNKILGEIIRYYAMKRSMKKNKKLRGVYSKAKSIKDLEEILEKQIEEIIAASPNYMKWELKNMIPEEQRVINRKNIVKRRRIKGFAQKYVNWAITKEWEFSPVMENVSVKNFIPKMIKSGPGQIFKFVSDKVNEIGLTMSAGEEWIRTISFVIGVNKAFDAGLIKRQPVKDLKGEDLILAMEFGRLYSRAANFGLTPQDAPNMFHSPFGGGIIGKFKIWSVQKFAKDWKMFQTGLDAMLDYEDIIATIEDPHVRQTWRIWFKKVHQFQKEARREFYRGGKLRYFTSKETRMANHEFAQLRDFLLLQGPITLLMDLILFGPVGGSVVRYALRKFGLQSVGGMRSDLLGLMLLPLTILLRSLLDDEDESTTRWAMSNILRHSFVGLGVQKPFDILWSIMAGAINGDSEDLKHGAYEIVDPFIPFRGTFGPIIKQGAGIKSTGF